MKLKFYVDTHKGLTGPVMLALLLIYGHTGSLTSWLYAAMHGGYGLLWVLKSAIFPDKRWEKNVPVWFGIFGVWGALSLYWVGGWMVMHFNPEPPAWYFALAVLAFALGVFFHFGSDMQKHTRLACAPGLITDGFFPSVPQSELLRGTPHLLRFRHARHVLGSLCHHRPLGTLLLAAGNDQERPQSLPV